MTLKETHSSNASLLDEDDSDQDSGVEGDHVKGNAATGRTIPDDDQFDITDDAELQDSDDQLDIDILAQDRERQQEQDNDLCKYQVCAAHDYYFPPPYFIWRRKLFNG